MNHTISDMLLSQISEFIAAQMGLHFPRERRRNLERGLRSAAREFAFKDAESCIKWLLSSHLTKNQIEILASHLTIGETYFFRDKNSLEILKEQILPELIRSRRDREKHLRIWSAGCSTGEEPFSLAILLSNMLTDLSDWKLTILATDINPLSLRKALAGAYNEWSFRDTPPWVKQRCFREINKGHYEILPHIKKLVNFSYLNLVEDSYPSFLNNTNAMDIIFCRNVLMYFTPEVARKVIQNIYRCLVDGGWLIVSPSETSHVLFSQFATVSFPNVTFYRKDSKKSQPAEDFIPKESPYFIPDEAIVPFYPPLEHVTEPELEITFPREQGEAFPLKDNREPETGEPQPIPYTEALMLYEQGRYEEAVNKILFMLQGNQDNPNALTLLARAYANLGKLSKALEWCEKAIIIDKLNPCCHYLLAIILHERGQTEEAVASLKRAVYLDQDFVLAHFALGNLNQQRGKLKESEKHFGNALSLLSRYRQEDILPESEGMTAGRLKEIIQSITAKEAFV